jgi:hypothetical protein
VQGPKFFLDMDGEVSPSYFTLARLLLTGCLRSQPACYALSLGWSCSAIFFLCVRGPRCKGWLGWGGDYSLRKKKPALVDEEKREEEQSEEREPEPEIGEETAVEEMSEGDVGKDTTSGRVDVQTKG